MKKIFVTGIGTEVGKTVVSAILVEALQADYWKPVQAGNLDNSDTEQVRRWITNPESRLHPESYRLRTPISPHAAAKKENQYIDLEKIQPPRTNNHLIIEGAGGVLVPLNQQHCIIDLIKKLNTPVVIVSKHYLGSINHTLLTIKALEQYKIEILGLIFNGEENRDTESFISSYTGLSVIGRVYRENFIDPTVIQTYAQQFKKLL